MERAVTATDLRDDWEFAVLGVSNFRRPGKLTAYFEFLRDRACELEGDVCEVGVYRGASLLASALLLTELGSDKRIIGFDSFTGFPELHFNDELERFSDMLALGRISREHHEAVMRNRAHRSFILGAEPRPETISGSGSFSATSVQALRRKIEYLGLRNIDLVEGRFDDTMSGDDRQFCAVLMDCDLYLSHRTALAYAWERLVPGGMMYLDEYYSLKFPGARLAIDEFFAGHAEKPEMLPRRDGDFERWIVVKNG